MRTLASIQTIRTLSPIQGADRIMLAGLKDIAWKCVVPKDAYQIGEPVVYIEIDSLLPRAPWNEFLFKPDDKKTQHRVRTIRLRGQISQGIIFPYSILLDCTTSPKPINIEGDIAGELGITKYEPPISACLSGICKGPFPSYIPKTDETRIQAYPDVLKEIVNKEVYITVKCDGASGTFLMYEGELEVCSRELSLREDKETKWQYFVRAFKALIRLRKPKKLKESTFWKIARKYQLKEKLSQPAYDHLAIQGEVCGPGIQGNRLELKDHELFVFNIYDTIRGEYLGWEEYIKTVLDLKLINAPLLYKRVFEPTWTVDSLLKLAEGNYEGTTSQREGIVIRPVIEARSEVLKGRLSFKAINNQYLLKGED